MLRKITRAIVPLFVLAMFGVLSGLISVSAVGTSPTWTISDQVISQEGKKPDFVVAIHRPVLESSTGSADPFNQATNAFVKRVTDRFFSLISTYGNLPPSMPPSRLLVWYDILSTSQGIISVQFSVAYELSGSANYGE